MKKVLALLVVMMLSIASIGACFADATYYIGDFNRSPQELKASKGNFKIMSEKELDKVSQMKYSSKSMSLSATRGTDGKPLIAGNKTDDGGLVVNLTWQGTDGYDELMDNGYTDLNYSFWGTWCWANNYFCNKAIGFLDAGSSAAQLASNVATNMTPALYLTGVTATGAAATALVADIADLLCTASSIKIENEMTDMGIALKTTITGLIPSKIEGQYVAKLL